MEEKDLFSPSVLNHMPLKNRFLMAAMHLGYAENNEMSQRALDFYRARAKGGIAALTVVAKVAPVGGPPDMHGADSDDRIPGLKQLADVIHAEDCRMIVQLFHSGRNAFPEKLNGLTPVSASAVPSPIYRCTPHPLTTEEIDRTVEEFAAAARRCRKAGVDAVEISCSAGYLLTQFISPLTNLREDEYGGSEENRFRFPRRVIRAVREAVGPDYPVLLRISASDMLPGGYGIDCMQRFCAGIAPGLVDAISVTGGWHEAPVPQITADLPDGGYAFLAGAIKRVVDVPVIASNRIHSREAAERILALGLADYVSVARPLLADPCFVQKLRNGALYNPCQSCNRGCIEHVLKGTAAECAFNCMAGHEWETAPAAAKPGKLLVVGGGPAGMTAAKLAAQAGWQVCLCTRESRLGGLLNTASLPPHKARLLGFLRNLEHELEQLQVEIRYGVEVDEAYLRTAEPDHIILATGSTPIVPSIPGLEPGRFLTADEALHAGPELLADLRKGSTVIVGGGSVGMETAHFLCASAFSTEESPAFLREFIPAGLDGALRAPLDLTVLEMGRSLGHGLGGQRWILSKKLKEFGVRMCANTRVTAVGPASVTVQDGDGERELPCDHLILACGYRPAGGQLAQYLEQAGIPCTVVGDAKQPRDVMAALTDARLAVQGL